MTFLKFTLLFLSCLSGPTSWQSIRTDQQISFSFPNYPQKLERLVNGIPSVIYQTKDPACVTGVVCSDLSGKKIRMTTAYAQSLYEELKKGTLQLETAVLKNEMTVPYAHMLIKEIEYTIMKDHDEMTYFKRFIFRDNYIYQIAIGGRTRHLDIIQKEKEIFFNSVAFPAQEGTENNSDRNIGR